MEKVEIVLLLQIDRQSFYTSGAVARSVACPVRKQRSRARPFGPAHSFAKKITLTLIQDEKVAVTGEGMGT